MGADDAAAAADRRGVVLGTAPVGTPTTGSGRAHRLPEALRRLRTMPMRYHAVVVLAHTVPMIVIAPALRLLGESAAASAGLRTITDRTATRILEHPDSLLLTLAMGLTGAAVTIAWTAVVLVVAVRHGSGAPVSVRGVGRDVLRAFRRLLHVETALLALPLLLAPLFGFALLSPFGDTPALPPFIGREFLKAPLSAIGWVAGITAIGTACLFALVVLASSIACDVRPRAIVRRALTAARRDALRLAVAGAVILAMAHTAVRLAAEALDHVATAVPAGDAASVRAAQLAGILVGVATTQLFASLLVLGAITPTPVARQSARSRGRERRVLRLAAAAPLTALLLLAAPAATAATPTSAIVVDPLIIGHRGYDRGGVENTIGGLDAAAAFSPDLVEVDVQQTLDGGFVASHDTNLLVLAGVDENLFDMTTAEATSTTVRMHGNEDRIPTMLDYARHADDLGVPLLIEFKVTGHERPGFVEKALDELETAGLLSGTIFHSLDPAVVETIGRLHPELTVGLTIAMLAGPLPATDCDFYVVEQASIDSAVVHDAHDRGRPLYAWTVNDERAMRSLLREGVDGLVTDDPRAASRAIATIDEGDADDVLRERILEDGVLR